MVFYLIALIISMFGLFSTLVYISGKKGRKNQMIKAFSISVVLMISCCFWLVLQICMANESTIKPVYFDYLVYISTCLFPITLYFMAKTYEEYEIKFKRRYLLLFIAPILCLLVLWTNDFHHLFFKKYSIYMNEVENGPFMIINSIYIYVFFAIGIIKLLKFTVRNSGFFSKQSLLIALGILVPLIVNILGTLQLIRMTIYVTPICFTITLIFWSIAIFKYNLLEVSPIAFQNIIEIISDSYILLNENNIIIDCNKSFLKIFNYDLSKLRGKRFEAFLYKNDKDIEIRKFDRLINESKESPEPISIVENFDDIDKIFEIVFNRIISKGKVLGTVVLFKDITEHTKNLKKIEENQYVMQRQAQFAILGEFAGRIGA